MAKQSIHDQSVDTVKDEQLALGIQQGQREHLTILVERYHRPLHAFLYRITGGNRPLAEDMVQETFLRVLYAISQYHYPRPFKPWLYTIANNLARDHYKRAETRYTDSIAQDMLDQQHSSLPTPDDILLLKEEARQVVTALWTLSIQQRETIILRYYQDLSLNEISQILDIPVGTIKSRLSIGLKRLQQAMVTEGGKHESR